MTEDREEIQAELRRLREWTDDARDVEAYNAAAAMVGRGDRRGAMRALEALVASCKSPRVCAQAKAELVRMK